MGRQRVLGLHTSHGGRRELPVPYWTTHSGCLTKGRDLGPMAKWLLSKNKNGTGGSALGPRSRARPVAGSEFALQEELEKSNCGGWNPISRKRTTTCFGTKEMTLKHKIRIWDLQGAKGTPKISSTLWGSNLDLKPSEPHRRRPELRHDGPGADLTTLPVGSATPVWAVPFP